MKPTKTVLSKVVVVLFFLATPFVSLSSSEVTLRLNLSKGYETTYRSTSKQVITQTMGGVQQVVNQTQIIEYKLTVNGVDAQNNLDAKIAYTRIAVDISTQGMNISYDSDKEDQGVTPNPQVMTYKALVNKSINATISPRGEVLSISGVDEMLDQILDELTGGNEAMKTQMRQTMAASINDDAMKQMFGGAFITLPEKSIKPSSSWTENQSIKSQFTLNVINSYSVKSVNPGDVELSLSATMSTVPGNKSTMQGMDVTYNLFGTQNGTLKISKKTGQVIESNMEQNITGSLSADMMGQKMDIPMTINSKISTEIIK